MTKFLQIAVPAMLLVLTACVDTKEVGIPNETGANTFLFSTSQTVEVTAAYTTLPHNTRVEIYTENPVSTNNLGDYVTDASLTPVASGYTDEEGHLRLTLHLKQSATKLYIYSPSVGAPVLLSGTITNGRVDISENNTTTINRAASTRAFSDQDTFWKNWAEMHFTFRENPDWSWGADGKPTYLVSEPLKLDPATLNMIDNTIPKGEQLNLSYAMLEHIEISEAANVTIYYVSNGSDRHNTLGYYTYTGTHPTLEEVNKSLTPLFPNLSGEVLSPGDGIQLEYFDGKNWTPDFPANTKIGFVLLTKGWENNKVAKDSYAVYSYRAFNKYFVEDTHMGERPHMAAFDAKGYFILSFEDLPYRESINSAHKGDFRDNVFVLRTNPITALPPVNPGVDPDDEGELPPYYMEIQQKGVIAFEDLWPYKGDYDMNDVVVKYDSKLYLNTDFEYIAIDEKYTFLNYGGKIPSGFGIEYDFPLSAVKTKVLGATNSATEPIFDTDLTKATLMFFDNAEQVRPGTEYSVRIIFSTPQPRFVFVNKPPYNPFIMSSESQSGLRKEVHLVNKQPTPKADLHYFGTGHDLSGNGRYYVSNAAYPFAIDMSDLNHYNIPVEMTNIGKVYTNFDVWASSNGVQHKDWYFQFEQPEE